ncbi:RagB/SusD domain protein [Pseudopedobacter saltans DSM 12145]|uniref:RagB/SusD domain protein n=1 Tax=Pseudopedobacter saltans (strain ATCC 51119 / DSM 12145 / JCM 21818 / CCUG 39354 / LMG 10337 / NBRC 100064 / NCIMB 13643) TaxID=762903 RepID=F0S4X4_PSESL|nr:RagB/SusD family nutrient uptake outer membrane protein [Pseudopedobacter saltans]ADY54148.1 RagB/SusD domain protein [Pseudopedobacter saltans DSM 12145]
MKKIKLLILIAVTGLLGSCNKFLDVVPDNIATIEYAFNLRASAEKFLFTCYSYMPANGHFNTNPGFTAADEIWYANPPMDVSTNFYNIALGLQNVSSPYGNFWSGSRGGKPLFQGIRDCNIFIENIDKVTEMDGWEKGRWKAEAKFLKAYYHFYLMRMYGPIPIIKENLPISASPEEVKVYREPVDDVVAYIVQLLDEVYEDPNLPETLGGAEQSELGRITKPIVLALKAKVLVTAASPLFNGNPEYAGLKDKRGVNLFNPVYDQKKWEVAAEACKTAIDYCHSFGYALNETKGLATYVINDTIGTQLKLRTAFTSEGNTEVIWANTNSMADVNMQRWSMGIIKTGATSGSGPKGLLAPTLKMAETFYTRNGLPITEDKSWDYDDRYGLRVSKEADRYYVELDSNTVKLHFDREPRFYASLGFDRGIWFGNWVDNYNVTKPLGFIRGRSSEISARQGISNYSITGYWIKKLVNLETAVAADGNITNNIVKYPWPEIRLSDLYLLCAEALNEVNGYTSETVGYLNAVRVRAGIPTVEDSWDGPFSKQIGYYRSKENLRKIIHQERSVELAFEGQRFWDLKRWKEAHRELNQPIRGWDITQKSANSYYRPVLLFNQHFTMKEYLWPIETKEMQTNRNLVQNVGW